MSGRVVVITGAAGGIGSAMMRRFAAHGDVPVGLDLADGFDVTDPAQCVSRRRRGSSPSTAASTCCATTPASALIGDVVEQHTGRLAAGVRRQRLRRRQHVPRGHPVTCAPRAAGRSSTPAPSSPASASCSAPCTPARRAPSRRSPRRWPPTRCATAFASTVSRPAPWRARGWSGSVAATDDPEATYEALRKRQPMGSLVTLRDRRRRRGVPGRAVHVHHRHRPPRRRWHQRHPHRGRHVTLRVALVGGPMYDHLYTLLDGPRRGGGGPRRPSDAQPRSGRRCSHAASGSTCSPRTASTRRRRPSGCSRSTAGWTPPRLAPLAVGAVPLRRRAVLRAAPHRRADHVGAHRSHQRTSRPRGTTSPGAAWCSGSPVASPASSARSSSSSSVPEAQMFTDDGLPCIDSPEAVAAVEQLCRLAASAPADLPGWHYDQVDRALLDGRIDARRGVAGRLGADPRQLVARVEAQPRTRIRPGRTAGSAMRAATRGPSPPRAPTCRRRSTCVRDAHQRSGQRAAMPTAAASARNVDAFAEVSNR